MAINAVQIEIEYLGQKFKMEAPPSYEEFQKQLCDKFFITEKMQKRMNLTYLDNDEDINAVSPDEYAQALEEADSFKIEIYEEPKSNDLDVEKYKKDANEKIQSIKAEIDEYEENLKKMCEEKIVEKLKEIDKRHNETLENVENKYKDKLNKIKEEYQKSVDQLYLKIKEKSEEMMVQKMTEYNDQIQEEIDNLIKTEEKEVVQDLSGVDYEKLEKKQMELSQIVINNKSQLGNLNK